MRTYELPEMKIRKFSREVVTDVSAKTAWEQAMAEAQAAKTAGTISIKLQKAN